MAELKPVCRFDPDHPQKYRNSDFLRTVLKAAILSMRNEKLVMSN
jgi:hypothetical protein